MGSAKQFNPLKDVPSNDYEALLALERRDEILTTALCGLYRAYRAQGADVLDSFEKVLRDHLRAVGEVTPPSPHLPQPAAGNPDEGEDG
jgi:hypothetical protein